MTSRWHRRVRLVVLFALLGEACAPRAERRLARAVLPLPAPLPLRTLRIHVGDEVALQGQVTDDTIPGNQLRRRSVSQLPAALRKAMNEAGYRFVAGDPAQPHDVEAKLSADLDLVPDPSWEYIGRRYLVEGSITLALERGGRPVDTVAVRLPASTAALAAALVDALDRSALFLACAREVTQKVSHDISAKPLFAELEARIPRADDLEDFSPAKPAPVEVVLTPRTMIDPQLARESEPEKEPENEPENEPESAQESAQASEPEDDAALPRVIAVLPAEDVSRTFSTETLEQLTEYVSTKVIEVLDQRVAPREQLRTLLVAEKSKTYRTCADQRCQIALGKALSARDSLSTKLLRVGNTCAITMTVYDLETELAQRAASAKTECTEDALFAAVDQIVPQLRAAAAASAAPAQEDPQSIDAAIAAAEPREPRREVSITPARRLIPVRSGNTSYPLQVRLDAPLPQGARRPGLNIALVLATATSLQSENKLSSLQRAAVLATRYLRADDLLTIVAPSLGRSSVAMRATRLARREAIAELIGALPPEQVTGNTDLSGGLEAALHELEANIRHDNISRVILIADAPPDEGVTDARGLGQAAERIARAGASLSAIAFGAGADGELLERMAALGGGVYYSVPVAEELPGIFARELERVVSQSMGDVAIDLDLAQGVILSSSAESLVRLKSGELRISAGSLAAAETRAVPLELSVRCRVPGPMRVARVRVGYRNWRDHGHWASSEENIVADCAADR